jgi:hydroxymethylbilane synthase
VIPLRLGTRGSALALWQARTVAARLEQLGHTVEIVTISTRGDRRQTESLAEISAEVGKGVFTKELQDAMFGGRIDLAVHSAKDMSAATVDGLSIAAVLEREDPRDALVATDQHGQPQVTGQHSTEIATEQHGSTRLDRGSFSALAAFIGTSPRFGTGSPRRVAQLRRFFPGASFEGIRGNVDTRLRKLDSGAADALVLACAGLKRLGFASRISAPIPVDVCVPAPGQGIIAIETRSDDTRTRLAVVRLNDGPARDALAAEQAVVAALGGGCQLPLGAFAEISGPELRLRAVVAGLDGGRSVSAEINGHRSDAAALGRQLAEQLASRGALELLHD